MGSGKKTLFVGDIEVYEIPIEKWENHLYIYGKLWSFFWEKEI